MFGYKQEFSPAPITEDYFLEGQKSLFSVVIPEATENLVINPSPVTNTTGYSSMAGAIASSTTRQRRGPNSIRVAPTGATTDGAYYGTVTTVTGWNTFSLDFWGYPGVPYKIYFATTGAALLGTAVEFVGEGMWRRPEVKLYEASGTTRRVYFTKNGSADTNYFYVDGLQVEAKDHSTTFCMGDMVGFVPGQTAYYWTGAYYGSTSVRIADTGSGGRVVPLSDYGFKLLGFTGLGMSEAVNISFPYARADGENYQTTRMAGRDFSLMGEISGSTMPELMSRKADLVNVFHPNRTPTRQPILLRYQYTDAYGIAPYEDVYNIVCSYLDGLRGSTTNKYQERVGLNFRMANPDIYLEGVGGASLSFTSSITNTAFVAARIGGTWKALGTGFNGAASCIRVDKTRGRVWFCGSFATANGVTVNGICYWDIALQTFVAVGGATKGVAGVVPRVNGMTVMPNGDVWIFGVFTSAGGSATVGIARWNNATDTFTVFNLASAGTKEWYGGCVDSTGIVYMTSSLTSWNGDAAQAFITSYTPAGVWTPLGTQPFTANENSGRPNALAVDAKDKLYVGSTSIVTNGHLRRWDKTTSAWTDLGATTGTNQSISSIYVAPDNDIYCGGSFSTFAGITLSNVFRYNGSSFYPLSSGFSGVCDVIDIDRDSRGLMIFKGMLSYDFSSGTSTPYALWNGSSFHMPDILTLETTNYSNGARFYGDDLYMAWGIESGTTSTAGYINSLNYTYQNSDNLRVVINGPTTAGTSCTLVWLENQTTKKRLFFNLVISTGEIITLQFLGKYVKVYSSIRGAVSGQPLPGSDSIFDLLNLGTNIVDLFITGTTTGVSVSVSWPNYRNSLN